MATNEAKLYIIEEKLRVKDLQLFEDLVAACASHGGEVQIAGK
jgi:hypothetical protein